MTREEIAGYMILATFAVMLIGVIKMFGLARVMAAIAGLMLLAVTIAFRSMRATSRWRY